MIHEYSIYYALLPYKYMCADCSRQHRFRPVLIIMQNETHVFGFACYHSNIKTYPTFEISKEDYHLKFSTYFHLNRIIKIPKTDVAVASYLDQLSKKDIALLNRKIYCSNWRTLWEEEAKLLYQERYRKEEKPQCGSIILDEEVRQHYLVYGETDYAYTTFALEEKAASENNSFFLNGKYYQPQIETSLTLPKKSSITLLDDIKPQVLLQILRQRKAYLESQKILLQPPENPLKSLNIGDLVITDAKIPGVVIANTEAKAYVLEYQDPIIFLRDYIITPTIPFQKIGVLDQNRFLQLLEYCMDKKSRFEQKLNREIKKNYQKLREDDFS